ncbi:MAG: c-type cytochrome domain-containing protein [Verrucomicrobiales bacterium]
MIRRSLTATAALPLLAAAGAFAPASPAEAAVDFEKQILPIFSETCFDCHGGSKKKPKGGLNMVTKEAIMKGGDSGESIIAGKPDDSELYLRTILPADDDDIMPPKGDPLTKEQQELIKLWIAEGANFGHWEGSAPAPDESELAIQVPPITPEGEKAMEALNARGAVVMRLSQAGNEVAANLSLMGDKAGDAELAALAPVAAQLTQLNLTGTSVTDAGLAALGQFKELRKLHLARTGVTDAGLAQVAGLEKLEFLNLFGTPVTKAGMAHLAGVKSLKQLFLFETKIDKKADADPIKNQLAHIAMIDFGWSLEDLPDPEAEKKKAEEEAKKKAEEEAAKKKAEEEAAAKKKAEEEAAKK